LGLDKTTPLAVIHGPKSKNGIGILEYGAFQLLEHIKTILNHLETDSPTGILIRTMIENHSAELGIEDEIWNVWKDIILTTMSKTWIKNTIQNMKKYKMVIQSTIPKKLTTWRVGDKMLMDMILHSPGNRVTVTQMRKAQEVRRFLKVLTLSDILVQGEVLEEIWNAVQAQDSRSRN